MSLLFVQNWDVLYGMEDDYTRFIGDVYIPETTSMGFVPVGGYYVEVGVGPRIIAVHTAGDLGSVAQVVGTKRFKKLSEHLKSLVSDYKAYVLEPTGRTRDRKYTIQKGVWKFNQYYDLRPGMKEDYVEFILGEHLPAMGRLQYVEVTGGWNTRFGGVSDIIAEFTFKDPRDIGRLLGDESFRKITLKLKNEYAMNYSSRILRCTERFDDHKWFRL